MLYLFIQLQWQPTLVVCQAVIVTGKFWRLTWHVWASFVCFSGKKEEAENIDDHSLVQALIKNGQKTSLRCRNPTWNRIFAVEVDFEADRFDAETVAGASLTTFHFDDAVDFLRRLFKTCWNLLMATWEHYWHKVNFSLVVKLQRMKISAKLSKQLPSQGLTA